MAIDSKIMTNNLLTISNNISKSPNYFRINKKSGSIQENGFIRRHLLSLFYAKSHLNKLEKIIDKNIQLISALDREEFIGKHTEPTDLFLAVQKYNQTLAAITKHKLLVKSVLANKIKLNFVKNDKVSELNPTTVIGVTDQDISADLQNDKPAIVKERRFVKKYNIRRYPNDNLDHAKEAGKIFTSTQRERVLSVMGRVIEGTAKIFGHEVTAFQKYHYRTNNETDEQIYAPRTSPLNLTTEPTSFWLGHATLFLSIPLKSDKGTVASFNVITDPVEGDLHRLLYPRQTKFARPMEETPAPDVYLLSHNHMDHYNKETVKKIFAQQPIMVVPVGDGDRYAKLAKKIGFDHANIIELDWWEKKDIEFEKNGERYHMQIAATPARHWSGIGPCDGHESTFLGYVIQGNEGGDIYFAGDTARLNDDHIQKLRENFNIRWNFQPGGPDEVRKNMESTHQASVDGLWMHFKMMISRVYQEGMDKEEFLRQAGELKTIYMHTMAYKLGNLHLSDTKDSLQRVLAALSVYEDTNTHLAQIEEKVKTRIAKQREKLTTKSLSEKKMAKVEARLAKTSVKVRNQLIEKELGLKSYEKQVYDELCAFAKDFVFEDGKRLLPDEISKLLQETVIVSKIGARLGLETRKEDQLENTFF
ncbi:putative uncharacterized protein [Parachlamydia acanthamoebae UV-7]|jgi:L-ascorbate metabolism protein UlaG (beta-lactamase superfamily)|uniref:Metallo-beta-lactamase domain-containing protein n=2 Tax=Parachlamydia acanthamoebae TaxID=83552 RepID=F8L2K5_PARAV|nr:MBL fold metallo-hydrolase [Parachlamydia acanthamoebae]EFB40308.1 hypothetical protein pah_c209o036 [Parachlamydia acanthamoebae str. Hall's coccus]KIA76812.1 hypothetical protein DB43_HJ00230 [Parachlamydia acanthamoebae]CCB87527.1 putative uncharacterized protein [Parachlamydia acanthamoebae UV-7]